MTQLGIKPTTAPACCAAPHPSAPARILQLKGRGSIGGCIRAHNAYLRVGERFHFFFMELVGTEAGFDVFYLFLTYHITKASTEERNEEILSTHYSAGNFRGTLCYTNFWTLTTSLYDL